MAKRKTNPKVAAGVGTGVALAAAAAGAYFLYGTKTGAKQRKKIRGWALKAKGEILEKMEKLPEINAETYHDIVDRVLARYRNLQDVSSEELEDLTKEMKRHWKNIQKEMNAREQKTGKKSARRK